MGRFKASKFSSSNTIAIRENKLYLTCDTENNKALIEIDIESQESKTIKEWRDNTILSSIYVMDEKLVLFNINEGSDNSTEYCIELIDLINLNEISLEKEIINHENGVIIPCIAVDKNYIYAYKIFMNDGKIKRSIVAYDSKGNVIYNIPINLTAFLYSDSEVDTIAGDSIIDFYKEGNYFIFGTVNGRISIWHFNEKNEVEQVEIPQNLYANLPSGYRFLDHLENNSKNVYFVNPFKNDDTMYVFNIKSSKFKTMSFPYDKDCLYRYYTNGNEDFVIKEIKLSTDEQNYYLLKANQLEKEQ